jgi:hypothetical protein
VAEALIQLPNLLSHVIFIKLMDQVRKLQVNVGLNLAIQELRDDLRQDVLAPENECSDCPGLKFRRNTPNDVDPTILESVINS